LTLATYSVFQGSREPSALWNLRCREEFGEPHQAHTAIESAQQASTDDTDRGGEDGAANNPDLATIYDREKQRGNANRATLDVARKLVVYLVAVDCRQKAF
jgi:hypothetical protein